MNINTLVTVLLTDKGNEIYWTKDRVATMPLITLISTFGWDIRIGNKCFYDEILVGDDMDANVYFLNQHLSRQEKAESNEEIAKIRATQRLLDSNVYDLIEALEDPEVSNKFHDQLNKALNSGNVSFLGRAVYDILKASRYDMLVDEELEELEND